MVPNHKLDGTWILYAVWFTNPECDPRYDDVPHYSNLYRSPILAEAMTWANERAHESRTVFRHHSNGTVTEAKSFPTVYMQYVDKYGGKGRKVVVRQQRPANWP